MRVLLVEDDRSLSAAVCKLLEKERIMVDPVYNGIDGLDWALGSEYDAIILDVMLPGMDGFCSEAAGFEFHMAPPCIFHEYAPKKLAHSSLKLSQTANNR